MRDRIKRIFKFIVRESLLIGVIAVIVILNLMLAR